MKNKGFKFKGSYFSYVLIYFFAYFAMASFSSVLSVYLTGTGKTATEMSFIVSAPGFFSFATTPIIGYICDRVNKPRLISGILLTCMGLMALVYAFLKTVWALFLLNGLIMSVYNATMPISERLATSAKYRYGILRVWGTFGYAAGAQAAAIAIQSFPPIVLFGLVFTSGILAAIGYAGAEDPVIELSEQEEKKEKVKLSSFLKNPHFLLYLLIAFICAGCSGVNMTYAPLLLNGLGVPTGAVGTVIFFSTIVEIPIILFSNKFMDKFNGKTLLLITFAIFLVQFIFYGFAKEAWVVIAVMVLLKAIASTMFMLIILKIVSNLVDPRLVTTGLSIVNGVNSLGSIFLQNAGGILVDRTSISTLYISLAGAVCLAAVLAAFLKVSNDKKVFG